MRNVSEGNPKPTATKHINIHTYIDEDVRQQHSTANGKLDSSR